MLGNRLRIGRPPSGRSPICTFAIPTPMLNAIDALAEREFASRAVVVRTLLELGMAEYSKAQSASAAQSAADASKPT